MDFYPAGRYYLFPPSKVLKENSNCVNLNLYAINETLDAAFLRSFVLCKFPEMEDIPIKILYMISFKCVA